MFFSFGVAFASDPFLQVHRRVQIHVNLKNMTDFFLHICKDLLKYVQFAREHGRQYKSAAEIHLRRQIFNENYKNMMEHNARFFDQMHW